MGMYTELIFGAALRKDTPAKVIEALKYMMGKAEKPTNFPLPEGRCEWLFQGQSYYFGVSSPVSKMWFDDIGKNWIISTRSNIKNYEREVEAFLEWIKPYIESGSGANDMYAVVMYEKSAEPKIHYLWER